MLKRYSYRAYPTLGQQHALSRLFGCVRKVYNDTIALREADYQTGRKYRSDGDVDRLVLTEAKHRPDTGFLSLVSATPLQQSVRHANQAYKNFFDSRSGKRKGSKVGHPRFKSRRDRRQAAAFTRGSRFKVRQTTHGVGKVFLPKVGWIRFQLSRELPSVPASVTIILNADGTYYVSFVVNAGEPSPLPPAGVAGVGIDAGIGDNLLHLTASDGTREKIANPRYLRAKERKLKRLSFAHSRKQKGSANREKARIKLARHHRKTTDARLDHHRKLARSIVTNHDVIALETLSLKGMGRTRLSKSVYDAGIGTLYRLITEYAETQGRTVIRIGRWEPTSQTCAVCGTPGGKKPLSIRQWVCTECGTRLDRDYNAALNILVAAGLAETLNACGPSIRRKLASAAGDEAGTHRSDHTLAA